MKTRTKKNRPLKDSPQGPDRIHRSSAAIVVAAVAVDAEASRLDRREARASAAA